MKVLLRSARVLCKSSPFHGKTRNILISNGKIASIGTKEVKADKVIDASGMVLSAGWFDLGAQAGDPGFEYREDLDSLNGAAAAGGFTDVALQPNTTPVVQSKNDIKYLTRNNPARVVRVWPIAAITRNCKGEELTEMTDLHHAGAVAFSDGHKPVWHTDIFLKTLQYLQSFGGVMIDHPEDIWLNRYGQMHEGPVGVSLGLKGMPCLAEQAAITKNLELLAYAGGRLHFSRISTARSVELIKAARKKGLQVTCDMTAYQALLDDKLLENFESHYKVSPPLRDKKENDALLKGLKDVIDVLCSGHVPLSAEEKEVAFEDAAFGMINWATFGSQLNALSEHLPWEDLIEKVTTNPRNVLGIPQVNVAVGEKACLTLFDPSATWTLDETTNLSKSVNTPWWKKTVRGKVVAVFNNGRQAFY